MRDLLMVYSVLLMRRNLTLDYFPCASTKDSDNALSEEATDLKFSYAPVIHGDMSIKLTNEKSTHAASTLCVPEETVQPRDPQINVLVIHERREVWDPGAATFASWFMTAADAIKLRCTHVYNPEMVQVHAVKFIARNTPIFASAISVTLLFGYHGPN